MVTLKQKQVQESQVQFGELSALGAEKRYTTIKHKQVKRKNTVAVVSTREQIRIQ